MECLIHFKPIPVSVPINLLQEGQTVPVGTIGKIPVSLRRSDGILVASTSYADIKVTGETPRAVAEAVEQLAQFFQDYYPELPF